MRGGLVILPSVLEEAHVRATVEEILPMTGLAYLTDDRAGSWVVTHSTPGAGLASLKPGQQLDLTVERHLDFSIVSGYAPLD
jgi:hypothetical protein